MHVGKAISYSLIFVGGFTTLIILTFGLWLELLEIFFLGYCCLVLGLILVFALPKDSVRKSKLDVSMFRPGKKDAAMILFQLELLRRLMVEESRYRWVWEPRIKAVQGIVRLYRLNELAKGVELSDSEMRELREVGDGGCRG